MVKRGNLDKGRCCYCHSKLRSEKEYLVSDYGKNIDLDVEICEKCGERFVNIKEYEKVWKTQHPSIFNKLKTSFSNLLSNGEINIYKGKIL